MARNVLMGYKCGEYDGRKYEYMFLASDLKEEDIVKGGSGMAVEKVYIPDNLIGFLKPETVGKELLLDFELVNGKAKLLGFQVKK